MNDQLRSEHITALFALMGVARAISNTELKELAGFTIDGKVRRTLEERRLITSTRAAGNKPFVHELTDAGWKRCEAELAGERPGRPSHLASALYLVLDGVRRYLDRNDMRIVHMFQPESPAPVDPRPEDRRAQPSGKADAAQVTAAYRELAVKQGDWVRLAELRPKLNGADRADVDRVLKEMSRSGLVHLAPDPDRKSLTAADREASIRIGGEDNHLVVVERS